MALYVVQVPDPAPGVDWLVTVPGQYLYDIISITGTLAGASGPSPTAHDATGNGDDGTYVDGAQPRNYVPGLISGDLALNFASVAHPFAQNTYITMPSNLVRWATPFTLEVLFRFVSGVADTQTIVGFSYGGGVSAELIWDIDLVANTLKLTDSTQDVAVSVAVPALSDGSAHLLQVTWDGVATAAFFVDGASVAVASTNPHGVQTNPYDIATLGRGDANAMVETLDEFALYNYAIDGTVAASHETARASGFVTYVGLVISDGAQLLYNLDDEIAPGRQVDLEVADGTDTVDDLPTGFGVPTSTGPYTYTWQPNLNASTETPDGAVTTVAIPRLILPAGYTIGTRTLDLAAGDQWSNVTIWWDDAVQNAYTPYNPYAYPPGAFLVYHQQGQ